MWTLRKIAVGHVNSPSWFSQRQLLKYPCVSVSVSSYPANVTIRALRRQTSISVSVSGRMHCKFTDVAWQIVKLFHQTTLIFTLALSSSIISEKFSKLIRILHLSISGAISLVELKANSYPLSFSCTKLLPFWQIDFVEFMRLPFINSNWKENPFVTWNSCVISHHQTQLKLHWDIWIVLELRYM